MKIMLIGALLLVAFGAQAQLSCQSVGVDYSLTDSDYAALVNSPSKLDGIGVEQLAANVDSEKKKEFERLCMTRLFNSQISPDRCTTGKPLYYWTRFLTTDERKCVSAAVNKRLEESLDEAFRRR